MRHILRHHHGDFHHPGHLPVTTPRCLVNNLALPVFRYRIGGETTLKKLVHAAIERGISIWGVLNDPADLNVNNGIRKKLDGFRELVEEFNRLNASGEDAAQLTRSIYMKTRLLTSLISDNTPESVSQQENLMEMQKNVEEFVAERIEEGNPAISMTDFLAEVSLATDQDEKDTSKDRVTLMTVHAAKGLEFKNVID